MQEQIIDRLLSIEQLLKQQNILQKEMLSTDELCQYICMAKSYLYKLTSANKIPYYRTGKYVYFKRTEIDNWLMRNKVKSCDELQASVDNFIFNASK